MKKEQKVFDGKEAVKEPIIDPSGVILAPGKGGERCQGNGKHRDSQGRAIECRCDECDYFMICFGGC